MTDRPSLDLTGFSDRATGVAPPPPPRTEAIRQPEPATDPAPSPPGPADGQDQPTPNLPRPPEPRRVPPSGGVARLTLNVPWSTSTWAKGVAKGLDLSLADFLRDILTRHTDTVEADLALHPPVGRRSGEGPYDPFDIRADSALRARITETATRLGFTSRSEFVSRLLDAARHADSDAYSRQLVERAQALLGT